MDLFKRALEIGEIANFRYSGSSGHDKSPRLLILNNNGPRGLVHAINLNYLSEADKKKIEGASTKMVAPSSGFKGILSRIPGIKHLVSKEKAVMDPRNFYSTIISQNPGFSKGYRTYRPGHLEKMAMEMSGVPAIRTNEHEFVDDLPTGKKSLYFKMLKAVISPGANQVEHDLIDLPSPHNRKPSIKKIINTVDIGGGVWPA